MGPDGAAFDKIVAGLPLTTCKAGEIVLTAGARTGRLLILSRGAVVVLKDGVEIATVAEPGAVLGELAALLDEPHTADVRALEDSQFHVADASLLAKEPAAVLYVAHILARRLAATNKGLVEIKNQLKAGQSPGTIRKVLDKIEEILSVGGVSFEAGA